MVDYFQQNRPIAAFRDWQSVANGWSGRLQMSREVGANTQVSADLKKWLQPTRVQLVFPHQIFKNDPHAR